MLSFAFDNVQYEASALGAWLGTRNRGVFSAGNNLAVSLDSGMQLSISPGLAWLETGELEGTVCVEETAKSFSLSAANSQYPRLDVVCMQLNKSTNQAMLMIKEGVPAAVPEIMPPTRNNEYDEIYLASVLVPASASSLSAENITDMRLNKAYCGLIRDGVTMIPIDSLESQISQLISQIRTAVEQQENSGEVLDGSITTNKISDGAVTKYYAVDIGTSWQNTGDVYINEVPVVGIQESDKPFIDIMLSDDIETAKLQLDAWGSIFKIKTTTDKITAYSIEPIEIVIPIQMEVHRK